MRLRELCANPKCLQEGLLGPKPSQSSFCCQDGIFRPTQECHSLLTLSTTAVCSQLKATDPKLRASEELPPAKRRVPAENTLKAQIPGNSHTRVFLSGCQSLLVILCCPPHDFENQHLEKWPKEDLVQTLIHHWQSRSRRDLYKGQLDDTDRNYFCAVH